jgi:cytochrome oxidase assembly protein ShyY1
MAAAKDVADAAPFYVEMEIPVPSGGLPHPGRVQPSLPNTHLQYALTWLGLAAVLVGVYTAWMFGRWRGRD